MSKREIWIENKYLCFPIRKGASLKCLEILDDRGEKCFEFLVPVGEYEEEYSYDYLAELLVEEYVGQKLVLQGEFPQVFWEKVSCTSKVRETMVDGFDKERPVIHFTPEYGWMNDPNGLVYKDGLYHMYFQYNPYDIIWNNMSWGHAVSEDLLHWKQLDTVLFPDENGTMFSGCGMGNDQGALELPKDALLFFYTAAGGTNEWSDGKEFTQRLAYSVDGGQTLQKLDSPYIPTIGSCKENRDPKVFWHAATQAYICALWLEGNDFAVLCSEDLKEWTLTDRFSLEGAWECPDLLKVTGESGEEKWLYWSADGYYFWGEFDGYRFRTDGQRHCAYMNKNAYAAQTYSGVEGRIVSVPWLRLPNRGRNYTGVMGLPREFTFRYEGEECVLVQKPVKELLQIREKQQELNEKVVCVGQKPGEVYLLELELPTDGVFLEIECAALTLSYDQRAGLLQVREEQYPVGADRTRLSLLVDAQVLELSMDEGVKLGMFELEPQETGATIVLKADKEINVQIFSVK
ncbi:MAG: glycoside hydrolase family 32 protein [Lachnospiraceae bacterium]|nr:glycoside hydrolase family 32 protein [Lachnospiraceae bacterium]